jgi:hypothetical protein
MRYSPTYFLKTTAVLLVALICIPASAEKLSEPQVKEWADKFEQGCHQFVPQYPTGAASFDVNAICSCSYAPTVEGLRNIELDNPSTLSDSERKKLIDISFHATWACAQPYYAKALRRQISQQCYGESLSGPPLTDGQKHTLCDCVGDKFAEKIDLQAAMTNKAKGSEVRKYAYAACGSQ